MGQFSRDFYGIAVLKKKLRLPDMSLFLETDHFWLDPVALLCSLHGTTLTRVLGSPTACQHSAIFGQNQQVPLSEAVLLCKPPARCNA